MPGGMRRAPLIGAALVTLALHATACGGSFQVVPTDIPRAAAGNQVMTTDGEVRIMPERFEAELELDESRGRLMWRDDRKHSIWIADAFVERAEQDGWDTTRFETEDILEADWGSPEARHAGERTSPRSDVPIGPHTTLWLRNHDGREAEVPLGAVQSLDVDGKASPGAKAAWIVPVALVGAVAVVSLVAFAVVGLERYEERH